MLGKSVEESPFFQMLRDRDTSDAKAYMGLLLLTEPDAQEGLEFIKNVFPGYTTHGMGHSLRILDKLHKILSGELRAALSTPEIFCLIMAAMFHDMGMALAEVDDKKKQRERHHLYAKGPLKQYMSQKLTVVKEWRRLYRCILFVCEAHGMELEALYKSEDFDTKDMIEGGELRFGLLSVLLRIGDLLDLDENRTSSFARGLNPSHILDETSEKHHLRHECIDRFYLSPESVDIQVHSESAEEHHIWESWLKYLENDILYANTYLMPKVGRGLCLPEPKYRIQESEGAPYRSEQLRFELTEEGRLWTILSQSVYTEEFDFIRELVQNGIDADLMKDYTSINTVHLPAPSPRSWGGWEGSHGVMVAYSAARAVLLVFDDGIGMDAEEVRRFLFKIADSGYRHQPAAREFEFPAIAKFGIGFISCLSKCEEIILLTQSAAQEDGCRVRMYSDSILAYFERLNIQSVSGTSICMRLKRGYQAEEVKNYLLKMFQYPSVPVVWLDLDQMEWQIREFIDSERRELPVDFEPGYRMSQEQFEKQYSIFEVVRDSIYRERYGKWKTVTELKEMLEKSYAEWCVQARTYALSKKLFEQEMGMLLRQLSPVDKHNTDVRRQLKKLLEESKKTDEKNFSGLVQRMLPEIEDCIYTMERVREELLEAANQFASPKLLIGSSDLAPLCGFQSCIIPLNSRFSGMLTVLDKSRAKSYQKNAKLFLVRCDFDDWDLGVEWRSVHGFFVQGNEIVLELSRIVDMSYDQKDFVIDPDEILESGDLWGYSPQEILEDYMGQFDYGLMDEVTTTFRQLRTEREQMIQTEQVWTTKQDMRAGWHTTNSQEESSENFLRRIALDLYISDQKNAAVIDEIARIRSCFYQDGMPIDVNPAELVSIGMCRARANLTAGARIPLNITRRHVDEAHDTTDAWLAGAGGEIQRRVVEQLTKTFEEWGFKGLIGDLCTKDIDRDGYFANRSNRQIRNRWGGEERN